VFTGVAQALKRGAAVGRESIKDYLDSIAAPAATRDLVSAWWTVSGNGDKTRVPAAEFLASASYHDGSPDGMCEVWAETLEGGVQTLCERMIAAEGIDVRFHHPVAAIAQNGASATITCASGQTFQAHDAVLATGLNPMAGITFSPPLSGVKAEGRSAGHLGRCVKVWAKLTGVAPGILATGGGTGIEWMFTERRTSDGAAFAVGFGVAANGWVPDFPRDVEQASARFFPEARLLDWDWHDWAGDPFARGAWVAGIVGQDGLNAAESWQPEPHLTFASSDIAASEAGWFEAAIISGQDAARASAAKLRIDLLTEL
jgi:monoamine oxidase